MGPKSYQDFWEVDLRSYLFILKYLFKDQKTL